MTSNHESGERRRIPGWLWVWGGLFVFIALEVARLA